MIMRTTWGKLRAGTWNEYEQAYHATVAGKEVPGLRGRWLLSSRTQTRRVKGSVAMASLGSMWRT